MVFVKVYFTNDRSFESRLYSYKAESALNLEECDIVVVQARDSFGIAKVQSVSHKEDVKATRWVVSKVDVSKSKMLDEITIARGKVKRALEARIAEREKKRALDDLCKGDPIAAELLEKLNAMDV